MKVKTSSPGTLIQRWNKMSARSGTPLYASIYEGTDAYGCDTWFINTSMTSAHVDSGDLALIVSSIPTTFDKHLILLVSSRGIGWHESTYVEASGTWKTIDEAPE